jgi:hypothetical protein
MKLEKNIFLLWLQGWEVANWLNKQVAESWRINNPGWKIHFVDFYNLKDYVSDIDYIYDTSKNISPQALSDIIRLSLLKNHGGVWADATMLCMQPLDNWVSSAVEPVGFWMYHGHGGGMSREVGPASWFIVSEKDGYMINKWKDECDLYWNKNQYAHIYCWMDSLFKKLFRSDEIFRQQWLQVPYVYCELDGQSHTLDHYGMQNNTPHIQQLFLTNPPYALKFWNTWNRIFPTVDSVQCKNSNGYYAIKLACKNESL